MRIDTGPRRTRWFVLLWAALAPAVASAQVNAEVLTPDPLREGWSVGLDGSLSLARGNIELLDVGGAARARFQSLYPSTTSTSALPFVRRRFLLATSGRFAERGSSPFINQAFAHLRWTEMWHERVGSDVFAQSQFNAFQRLQSRNVAGVGVRLEVVHAAKLMVWAGTGYMIEHNRIDDLEGSNEDRDTWEHRWTSYATVRLEPLPRLLIQNTTYVQPRLDAFSDVRLLEELEVLSRVTQAFSFGLVASLLHDSAPPLQVRPTDLRLFSMLRVAL